MIAVGAVILKLAFLVGLSIAVPNQEAFAEVVVSDVLELTNQARASTGVGKVELQENLNFAASLKAQHMLEHGYFDHYGPEGETPWQWFHAAGYRYTHAGENLANNFTDAITVHQAWMASPTHQENILNPNYDHMGLAIATGEINGRNTTLVVQLFGSTSIPPSEVSGESIVVNDVTNTADAESFARGSVQVETEHITSEIVPAESFWTTAAAWLRDFYLIVAAALALLLMIMISIRMEIQHHKTLAKAFLVVGVLIALSAIEIHFLDGLGRFVEIL